MKKQIPNLITCMNVISGTLAVFAAMHEQLMLAVVMILAGMVFDFFDGMTARLLHVKSEMGKELDSLADMVTFGLAPAILAFLLILRELPGGELANFSTWSCWEKIALVCPLLITPFSAYRLAKFNLDVRQSTSFIGMPTPANALFWVSLVLGSRYTPEMYELLFGNVWVLPLCALFLSWLLISELPMFSLKISGFGWSENKVRYLYFIILIAGGIFWGKAMLIFVIPLYILFALLSWGIRFIPSNPRVDRK